ncbi:hypothetical protein V6N12_055453 [Hibiscus sabdariffa]
MDDILRRGGRLVEECSRASSVAKGPQAGRMRASTWSRPRVGKDWSVVVNHVGRGSNGVADALAQRGHGSSMEQVSFSETPDEVACIVENEQLGSFPTTAMSVIDEHEVPFDPGGLS